MKGQYLIYSNDENLSSACHVLKAVRYYLDPLLVYLTVLGFLIGFYLSTLYCTIPHTL